MFHSYKCIVFLADGKHISQVEECESASEAMTRAEAWTTLGHIARAYLEVIDTKRCEVYDYPLV
jgi:hypothetical protein